MKVSELKRILRQHDCRFLHEGSNHEWWYSPITDRKFFVPRHDSQEMRKGTAEVILKQAGIK
ncbi:MAG: type II toxin-antitoxin system HicA family toxin [Schwartzia sp.]|nr:type II toxin-antitoxin system HicA family toxin [Schwartzia sp. (in: firmicutes)]